MELLTEWLMSVNDGGPSINQLIDKLNKEIENIESIIKENVRDEHQFRDYFHVTNQFIGQINESLNQANGQFKAFEGDTSIKIRELRDVLIQRNKQLQEAASKLADEGDDCGNKKREDDGDYLDEIGDNQGVVYDPLASACSSPLRTPNPVDEEEIRQLRLTKQLAEDHLVKARLLVNSDLFPVIKVGDDPSQIIPSNDPTINQSLLSFPVYSISQSIFDLTNLLKKMMEEAADYLDSEQRYLTYQATRSVIELYLVSQSVHQTKIADLPKYTAIFQNNCLWIAHQLTILPMVYGSSESERDQFIVNYVDLIPALKESAQDAIIGIMKKQKKILTDFFDDSEVRDSLKAASCEDSVDNRTLIPFSKALKKGLTHIKSIKNLWIDCLPSLVCNKLIGTLVNCLIAITINSILTLEDIPADTASRLGQILEGITKDVDLLMKDFTLPYGQILSKWLQFQEMKIILQASLADIIERWSDGNGPLAVAFTPEEVKSLIRSLFQNTDRRSAALNRIR